MVMGGRKGIAYSMMKRWEMGDGRWEMGDGRWARGEFGRSCLWTVVCGGRHLLEEMSKRRFPARLVTVIVLTGLVVWMGERCWSSSRVMHDKLEMIAEMDGQLEGLRSAWPDSEPGFAEVESRFTAAERRLDVLRDEARGGFVSCYIQALIGIAILVLVLALVLIGSMKSEKKGS